MGPMYWAWGYRTGYVSQCQSLYLLQHFNPAFTHQWGGWLVRERLAGCGCMSHFLFLLVGSLLWATVSINIAPLKAQCVFPVLLTFPFSLLLLSFSLPPTSQGTRMWASLTASSPSSPPSTLPPWSPRSATALTSTSRWVRTAQASLHFLKSLCWRSPQHCSRFASNTL